MSQSFGNDSGHYPCHVFSNAGYRSVEEKPVPTRAQQLKRLASGEEFDVLVVGGGATGEEM